MAGSKNPFDNDIKRIGRYEYTDPDKFSSRIANERYTRMILGAVDLDGKVIVDVGCGDGTYTAYLAEQSKAKLILGIDKASYAIERAQRIYEPKYKNIKFEVGTPYDLVSANRHFAVAIYRGVLHHMENPDQEIQNALKLAPKILLLEPNGFNIMMKIVERISKYHREHDESSFTPTKVCRWIASYGGKVERVHFFGLVPYFCPDIVAQIGRSLEPVMESIPFLKTLYCGQYILIISKRGIELNSVAE